MSASTASKMGSSARSAGRGIPDCAMRASRPTVFRVTVLPPVLGPVMTSSRRWPSSSMETGTTRPPLAFRLRSSSGWRALWRTRGEWLARGVREAVPSGGENAGATQAKSSAKRALANWSSRAARASSAARTAPARSAMRRVISSRMRWTSACSSSKRRTRSLFCSMVSSGEGVERGADGAGALCDAASHFQQDAVDLGLFFVEEANEVVVLLDGVERLDEDGLSAGAGAVYDAGDAAFQLDLDGDDEALAADGDQLVLHGAAFGETAEVATQRLLDEAFLLFDVAADAGELGRGLVVEGAVGLDLIAEGAEDIGEVLDGGGESRNGGPRFHGGGRAEHDLAPLGGAVDDEKDVADLGGFKRSAGDAGLVEERGDVEEAGEFKASANAAELADFLGELVLALDPGAVLSGGEGGDAGGAERGGGVAAQQFAQRFEFEDARAGVGKRHG